MSLHQSTPILLADGRSAPASEIKEGTLLMGPDSKPRKVIQVHHFENEAYEVRMVNGNTIICSADQALSLRKSIYLTKTEVVSTDKGIRKKYQHFPKVLLMTARDIEEKNSSSLYKCFFLHKTKIEFNEKPVPIDPYFLGVWLGDGHQNKTSITTMDQAIKDTTYMIAREFDLGVKVYQKKDNQAEELSITRGNAAGFGRLKNPLLAIFKELNIINNKHVPDCFLYNTQAVRLALLAGIIDTDGHLGRNVYFITQKNKILAHQIQWLANSVGLRADIWLKKREIRSIGFTGNYFEISIKGNIDQIPVRLSRKEAKNVSKRHDRNCIGFRVIKTNASLPMTAIITAADNSYLLADTTIMPGENSPTNTSKDFFQGHRERKWDKKLLDLTTFISANNRSPKEKSGGEESIIARWLNLNRTRYNNGLLSTEREQKLRDSNVRLGGVPARYAKQFELVEQYRNEFGGLPKPDVEYPQGNKLGRWWSRHNSKRPDLK